ncbi:MAG: secretin N-terminal domain-containing protein, partial [Planctomycetota bacterium]
PYTVEKLTLAQARSSLLQKIPALSTVELGGDPRVLYLLATDEEHTAAGQLLTELEAAIVPVPETTVTLYPAEDVDLTQLIGLLPTEIASRATIKPDPLNELLIVTAPAEVHAQLAPAITELSAKLPKLDKVTSRIYPLGGLRSRDWSTFLTTVAPGAVAAFDRTSGSLVVVGTRETHEKISKLLEDVRQAQTTGKVARPYRVSKADVTVVTTVLTSLFPEATLTPDTASRSLIAIASEDDQKSIEKALAEIDLNAPMAPVSQIYQVASGDATALATALKSLIPAATFVPDATGRSLLALANSEDQLRIKQTIEQWTSDPARALSTKVYQLAQANPATTLPILQKLQPAVTFSADPATRSIAAAATEEQHKAIAQAVTELDAVDSSISTKIYPLGNLTAKDWQGLLTQLAPGAVAAADPDSGSLIVAAPASTHEQIAKLMEEFKTAITQGKLARAYRLSKADATVAAEAISALLPNSKVSVDKISRSLIIVASEEDQQTAKTTIEQIDLNAPGAPVSEVYAVNTGDAAELALALKSLVPGASYVADKAGKSLLVLATPDEQTQIKKTVEQWTSDASRMLTTKVYQLSKADPAAALPVLQKLLPSATFSADAKTRAIAATATAEQHQSITAAVTELDKLTSPAETKVYPSGGLAAKDWQALVTQLAPDAITAVDPDSGSLIVAARPDIHLQLEKLVADFRTATTSGRTVRAYKLTQADAQVAADAITALSPTSRVSVDKLARSIVVVATESDQALIAQTVQQIDREATGASVSKIYPVATGDAASLATALKSLVPTGTYVADTTGKSLLVIASPQDQEILGKTVADWGGDAGRAVSSKVYGFENADPTTVLAALQKLIPGATLAADPTTRSLLATGTAEQHALLAATVSQLDSVQQTTGEVTLKTYIVNRAPADSIAKALGDLFKKDTQISVAADKDTNSLIAIARPRQHAMIQAMVTASEKEMSDASFGSQIQIYPLPNTDGESLVDSLEKLFQRQRPAPEITYDDRAQQLIVMGNAAQQALVQQLVVRLTGEQQEFEMFRLTTVDPFTAESAINGLFRNEARSTAPSIQTDFDNSYIFVRASQPQMTRIKDVLRKLGEPQVNGSNVGPTNNLMRVVPLGTDSERIIDQINKLWPQLQPNQLRIIESPENQLNKQQTPQQTPAPSPLPGNALPKAPAPTDKSTFNENSLVPSALAGFAATAQETGGPGGAATKNNATGTTTLYSPQDPAIPDLSNQERAPIFVIPGNRQLTIASSDPQAIQQMEELIKAIASPIADAQTSGNFETFPLKNAGASEVASILNGLFEDMGENKRGFGPPIVITADDRLNLLVVHGSRSDRETIGRLAEVLDSPDVNQAFSINQPEIVTVKNTDADRILKILQNVYRTQLASGGGRRQIPIPDGVSTEMATMLQQINAATSGPLLTLGVDGVTNSLIILAPQQLRDQVKATIEQLDRNVEVEPGEKIEIIQLKETNPARIQRALDLLFKQGPK